VKRFTLVACGGIISFNKSIGDTDRHVEKGGGNGR